MRPAAIRAASPSARYQQAEFAADLWQVYQNEGGDEYRHPTEFFRRTFLTQGLQDLLKGALRRLSGQGGDPVVELQPNFGGGKTHSMLALYHLFGGVLRLMAAVIHALWERQDGNLLILPATVPVDDSGVQFELTRYMEDPWVPVIEKDVDGPNSLPLALDREHPTLGRYSACRRVARTLYLGSAPTQRTAHRGLDDQRTKLGCVQPGETTATFGDALRRLADRATFLYADGKRYWYATTPTVTRLAADRANQLKEHDVAALAVTAGELAARQVEVVDAQLTALLPAQPGAVEQAGHEREQALASLDRVEEAADFLGRQDQGQAFGPPGPQGVQPRQLDARTC
jgi:hypothetical protein